MHLARDFFCILTQFFKNNLRNEPDRNLFPSDVPFRSRQSGWHDSWRSPAMCTGVTHRAGSCPVADVALRRPQLRQAVWRDLVTSTAVAWLLPHPTERRCSRAISIGTTHEGVAPITLAQLSGRMRQPLPFFFFLSSFLLLYSLVAPLAILSSLPKSEPLVWEIDSMSWYPNRVGYVCCL
jgi:hypothetical protein